MSDKSMGQTEQMPVPVPQPEPLPEPVRMPSTSDQRVDNNVMRHQYKVLSEEEKQAMQSIKDFGLLLHDRIDALGRSREVSLAKTRVEEAVMWAVKHITAVRRQQ